MSDHLQIDCIHHEQFPGGGVLPVRHPLQGDFLAMQSRLYVSGFPVVVEGDSCENESSSHRRPIAGASLVGNPRGRAVVQDAGQSRVIIQGSAVATLAGTIHCCCELQPIRHSRHAISLEKSPRLFIDGQAIVTGRSAPKHQGAHHG
jgi:uncharacterized Zn-binding protein involved in type VI secretion